MSETVSCKRCGEKISKTASVCKICGQEQSAWLYWIKQVGTPAGVLATLVGIIATLVAVSINIAKVIKENNLPEPSAKVLIVGYTTNQDNILEVDFHNTGNAPTRLQNIAVDFMNTYPWGGFDRYQASLAAEDAIFLEAGTSAILKIDLTNFGPRSQWSGSLFDYRLPIDVRNDSAGPSLSDYDERSYAYSSKCLVMVTGPFGSGGLHQFSNSGLCSLITDYAIEHLKSKPLGFVKVP